MSKKDYIAISAAIKETLPAVKMDSLDTFRRMADRIADAMQRDNGNFRRSQFMAACGFKES